MSTLTDLNISTELIGSIRRLIPGLASKNRVSLGDSQRDEK